ncbi:MAG: SDR family NAD(P)-dependent oxidoreductase [Deltaproteobacteria bacterium]|nr:MAG: SDR family NAD(P)-dependent oxidoreductase [Deltaproteobacteria bacterium]
MSAPSPRPVALITGASSGIGAATARRLAAEGYAVGLCARRRDRLEAVAAAIQDAGGLAFAHACDVRDPAAAEACVDAVEDALGPVRVLVNNAGLGRNAPLLEGPVEAWREMLDTNVLALCVMTRKATASMRAHGDEGHVVHIASMAAHRVPTGSGVYAATKFAVRALTEGLRRELRAAGSRIRVTEISPGFVETEFAEVYWGDPGAAAETYGRYRCLSADDVADLVAFAVTRPPHVQIHDILVRPTEQED